MNIKTCRNCRMQFHPTLRDNQRYCDERCAEIKDISKYAVEVGNKRCSFCSKRGIYGAIGKVFCEEHGLAWLNQTYPHPDFVLKPD